VLLNLSSAAFLLNKENLMKPKRTLQASHHENELSLKEIADEFDHNPINLDQDSEAVARQLAQRDRTFYDVHCNGTYK
jgi:hypothetical protein